MVALEKNLFEVGDQKLFQGGSKRMVRLIRGAAPGSFTLSGLGVSFTYTQRGEENILDEHILPDEFQRKRRIIDNHAPDWANAFFYDGGKIDEEKGVFSIKVDYFKIPD